MFLNRIHILKENVPTVEKKPLQIVLHYLGIISLQTKTKLQKIINALLNCGMLQVIFKSKNKLCNSFCFKDPVHQFLTSSVVCKFQCGLCNDSYCEECVKHLVVRSSKNIGISPLSNKRVEPRKNSTVCHHFLNYSFLPIFKNVSVTRIRSTVEN